MYSSVNVREFSAAKAAEEFPNVEVGGLNDTFALVLSLLEEGNIPLIANHANERRIMGKISPSAYNIKKLLQTQDSLKVNISNDKSVDINCLKDYMEVVEWIVS